MKCEICERECAGFVSLSVHIRKHKISPQQYYEQFLKKENEGICYCGKNTKFMSSKDGYHKYCCISCSINSFEVREKIEQTSLKRHGTKSPNQSSEVQRKKLITRKNQSEQKIEDFRKKILITWQNKSVDEIGNIVSKRKITYMDRSGYDVPLHNPLVIKKIKDTNLERTGFENPFDNPEIQFKILEDREKRTGYRFPVQNPKIFDKWQNNLFHRKKYKLPSGKIVYLLGEELQFLDFVFSNEFLKEDEIIYRPVGIKYIIDDGSSHYYFSDFFIPKFNLMIEIKSSYILSIQKNTDLKIKATKSLGYNYIMILDKKYDEFKNLIYQLSEQNQKVI